MEKMVELKDVLVNAQNYSWDDSLFLSEDRNWTLDSKCAVLNMDDLEDDEEVPKFATDNKLMYVLGIQDIQDIVNNAREQKAQIQDIELFEAFMYYFKNDAFITL